MGLALACFRAGHAADVIGYGLRFVQLRRGFIHLQAGFGRHVLMGQLHVPIQALISLFIGPVRLVTGARRIEFFIRRRAEHLSDLAFCRLARNDRLLEVRDVVFFGALIQGTHQVAQVAGVCTTVEYARQHAQRHSISKCFSIFEGHDDLP
ncbi:hypothetical protein D3C78_1196240 [compost metagenome]